MLEYVFLLGMVAAAGALGLTWVGLHTSGAYSCASSGFTGGGNCSSGSGAKVQTIVFTTTPPANSTVGETYTPEAAASSGLPVTIAVASTSKYVCSISGGTVTFETSGTCDLVASQAGDSTYAAATPVDQNITVGPGTQTLVFTSTTPGDEIVGDLYTPSAQSNSGLTPVITVDSSSSSVCSMSNGVVSFTTAGTCVLDANQAGNSNYLPASQVQQRITVINVLPACGVCILSTDAAGAITAGGNGTITLNAGTIEDDSSSSSALALSGNSYMYATHIDVVGGYTIRGGASASPTPTTGAKAISDPLASISAMPSVSGDNGNVTVRDNQTINPGVYGTIKVDSGGALTLNSGTYVITGGINVESDASFNASSGVLLYMTCGGYSATNTTPCEGSSGAALRVAGNATFDITAPSSGEYQGIAVMADRGNTAASSVTGNGASAINGTFYAAGGGLTLSGNGGDTSFNSVIITKTLSVTGNGTLAVYNAVNYNSPILYGG